MLLEEITMVDFAKGLEETRSIILPVGSVEEHGNHLPLGTDTIHAYELASLAGRTGNVCVAPPLWYGLCRSTSLHPGTVTVSGEALKAMVSDIVTSLYRQGLRNFVILSGHAGGTHMAMLVDAGETLLARLPEARIAVISIIDLVKRSAMDIVETRDDSHAGEVETSLMLHLRRDQVKGESPREYPSFPPNILVREKLKYWPGGVWGDPGKAEASKGERIIEREAKALLDLVRQLEAL